MRPMWQDLDRGIRGAWSRGSHRDPVARVPPPWCGHALPGPRPTLPVLPGAARAAPSPAPTACRVRAGPRDPCRRL